MTAANVIRLYHTGYEEIREPDIRAGRRNADFGQGFYLTGDAELASRWAQERKDALVYINTYELDLEGLSVHRFQRDSDWFRYLFDNRAGKPDAHPEADVIIGPIANDTIYDTFGIITSGFLSPEEALTLLRIGPEFTQTVLKTEKAASRLCFLSSRTLTREDVQRNKALAAQDHEDYQRQFAAAIEALEA